MATTDPAEWRLYDTNLTTQLAILPFESSNILIRNNEPGSGNVVIPLDASIASSVTFGQFCQLYYRGSARVGFFIDTINQVDADASENAGRRLSMSGPGAMALLSRSVVQTTDTSATTRDFTSVTKASILKTLIDEAQARGELTQLTYDFTASVDSASIAWTDSENYKIEVGKNLLDVAKQFAETGAFDFVVTFSAGVFTLSAYSAGRGTVKTTTTYLRIGTNCEEVTQDKRGDELYNTYYVKWKDGYITVNDATAVSLRGPWVKFLSLEQAQSSASATTFASAQLALTKNPRNNKTVKVHDGVAPRLWEDYDIGDTVSLDRFGTVSSDKILGIQADFDGNNFSHVTIDFNVIHYNSDLRMQSDLNNLLTQWNTAHDSDLLEVSQGLKIGTDGFVNAIHTYGDYIYIGGGFSIVNNLTVSYTARYQISTHTWAALTGITAAVIKIVDVSGTVYACTATKVYVLSGTAWSLVGTATAGNTLRCMASDGTSLYVGGNLTQMDAVTINGKVAKRTAGVWTDLNSNPITYFAESMAFFNSVLYIGFGGATSSSLKYFNAGAYTNVLNLAGKYVFAIKQVGSNLIIMSNDNNGGSVSTCTVYSWDGVTPGPGLGSAVTLGTISDFLPVVTGVGNGSCSINNYLTDVYIGGDFDTIDSIAGYAGIARYSGGIWSPLGGGVSTAAGDGVTTIEIVDNDIYIGGVFTTAFGVTTRDLSAFITDFQSLLDHLANDYASFDMGAAIHSAAASAVTDSDEFPFWEDTSSDLRKITWANIKATLKTYFDTLYVLIANLFNDSEGNPADIGTAADGTSSYTARRDHVHAGSYTSLSNKPIAETNTENIFGVSSPGGASLWTGTISGAPSGTSVTVSAPVTGTEAVLVPTSTGQLGKMRLYNLTRGTSALISNYNTGTNVITLTATVPAAWANGDSLTVASQTVSGDSKSWVDIEITSGPVGKSYLFLRTTLLSATVGDEMRIHPFDASFSTSKYFTPSKVKVSNSQEWAFGLQKIVTNVFSLAWTGTPTAVTVAENGYLE